MVDPVNDETNVSTVLGILELSNAFSVTALTLSGPSGAVPLGPLQRNKVGTWDANVYSDLAPNSSYTIAATYGNGCGSSFFVTLATFDTGSS